MKMHKKVTKSGGITIPRTQRQETGIFPGTPVDVLSDEHGIHITKHVPVCRCCGSVEDVVECVGIEICRNCAERINETFGGESDHE